MGPYTVLRRMPWTAEAGKLNLPMVICNKQNWNKELCIQEVIEIIEDRITWVMLQTAQYVEKIIV